MDNAFQDSSLKVRQFCLISLWIFCQTRSAVYLAASPKFGKPVAFCSSWDSLIHPFPGWRRCGINYVSIKNWESLRAHVAWAKGLSEAKPEGGKTVKLVSVDQRYRHKAICPVSEYNWQQRRATPHSGNHTHSEAAHVNSSWIDKARRVGEESKWRLRAVSSSITSQVSLITSTQSCSSCSGTSKGQEQIGV